MRLGDAFYAAFRADLQRAGCGAVDPRELFRRLHASLQPLPVMLDAVDCVRAEGIRTAALTNNWLTEATGNEPVCDTRVSAELRAHFDVVVESAVEGIRKPDPRAFELVCARLGTAASEMLYLDDLARNVAAAARLGLRAVRVVSTEQAIAELAAHVGFPCRGFVPGTTWPRPAHAFDPAPLAAFLAQAALIPPAASLLVRQFQHGQSNPTFYVRAPGASGRELVVRKRPPGQLLPSAHAIDREFRVMQALARVGVPVPPVHCYGRDPSVLGTEFYVRCAACPRVAPAAGHRLGESVVGGGWLARR